MNYSALCDGSKNKPFQCEDRLQTSESDVWSRQILTSKVGHRTERAKDKTSKSMCLYNIM